ncbi:MAG: hypothetical protein ABJC55_11900 [Algoriphagus sp.]
MHKSIVWSVVLSSLILCFSSCMSQEETISTTVIKLSTAVQEAKNWFGDQEEFIVETDYILARGNQ